MLAAVLPMQQFSAAQCPHAACSYLDDVKDADY
jgi:hypothetical protein